MSKHVLRPVLVVIGLLIAASVGRFILVPSDFGVHGKNFTYGYYRLSNLEFWENFKIKNQGRELCADCHDENYEKNQASPHKVIQCENCHEPAGDHPDNPEKLVINKDRELCYRCHAQLPYPGTNRGKLKGIDPLEHNPVQPCVNCHDPHRPNLEDI